MAVNRTPKLHNASNNEQIYLKLHFDFVCISVSALLTSVSRFSAQASVPANKAGVKLFESKLATPLLAAKECRIAPVAIVCIATYRNRASETNHVSLSIRRIIWVFAAFRWAHPSNRQLAVIIRDSGQPNAVWVWDYLHYCLQHWRSHRSRWTHSWPFRL